MRNIGLCCLTIGWLLCLPAGGQTDGTLSHRLIPIEQDAKAPSLDDFMSPEMLDMLREYHRLQSDQRRDRRNSGEGTAQSTRAPASASRPPTANRLLQEAQGLLERLDQRTIESSAHELADEISAVNKEFSGNLSGELAETMRPDAIPFDPNEKPGFWNNLPELLQTIQERQREATQRYNRAMKAYEKAWPTDNIPPGEWIKKVQPYINPELVRQFAEANQATAARRDSAADQRDRNRTRMQIDRLLKSGLSSPVVNGGQQDASRRMLDSMIGAVDKQSTEWLKRGKTQKMKQSSSWWKSLKARSSNRLSSLNRKITSHSRELATQRSMAWSTDFPRFPRSSRDVSPPGDTDFGVLALIFAAVITALGAATYWLLGGSLAKANPDSPPRIDAAIIRDRDSLLQACHELAFRSLGWPSLYWHHRQVFSELRISDDNQNQSLRQLCQLYEQARYTRGALTADELTLARQLFQQIQDVCPAAS